MSHFRPSREIEASGFVVLRSPLLSFDELTSWSADLEATATLEDPQSLEGALAADRAELRGRLRAAIARPEVREAIFVASPSLYDSIGIWLENPDSDRGAKTEKSLVRYYVRMCSRPTPFGLFAGNSIGELGRRTILELGPISECRRHTRLDMDFLTSLTDELTGDPGIRFDLRYRPNSSLYLAATRLRYAEGTLEPKSRYRNYRLVALEETDYLRETIDRAVSGSTGRQLAEALVDDEVTIDEALEFLGELIDSQVIVPELAPTVTGEEPIHSLVDKLRHDLSMQPAADALSEARASLDKIDSEGLGIDTGRYVDSASRLEALPTKVEISRLFQVDLVKPAQVVVGARVLDEISRSVTLLHKLAPRGIDPFVTFREAFSERYADAEVPLTEVLDEEVGIGFQASKAPTAETSPLLEGIHFASEADPMRWTPHHAHLLRHVALALSEGRQEIQLDDDDIEAMSSDEAPPLPDALAVMGTIHAASVDAIDRGEFLFHIHGVSGPSGARLLGRFCHTDENLANRVTDHLRAEERLRPEAIFAEIVHLPEGRVGNVLQRPLMRDFEIPFLGASGAPPSTQIPITDLMVRVEGTKVVLLSITHGREVIPRLTCAHNYTFGSLGVYRFLCALQSQGVAGGLGWDWGPLEASPFLPRMVFGKVLLARGRWLIGREELQQLAKLSGVELFQEVQRLRRARSLPRFAALADFDNELWIDFDNVLSIESFVQVVKNRMSAALVETLSSAQLPLVGPGGHYFHELVIPFVRRQKELPAESKPLLAGSKRRSFTVGSEWLYAKLYTGTSNADRVLAEGIVPIVRDVIAEGWVDKWFFVRYADPEWHIRIRFHGKPWDLASGVLPMLEQIAGGLMRKGLVWRLQLDTYQQEVARYGGEEGIVIAEEMFHNDSDAVAEILGLLSGDEGADARWRLALLGIDLLLSDFELDLEAKLTIIRRVRDSLGKEFGVDTLTKKKIGERFEKERRSLEELLFLDGSHPLAPAFAILLRRSERNAKTIAEMNRLMASNRITLDKNELVPSFVHMFINRILRSSHRAQEAILYQLADRLYLSRKARG